MTRRIRNQRSPLPAGRSRASHALRIPGKPIPWGGAGVARIAVIAIAVAGAAAPAAAQTWRFAPSVTAQETATNNVGLDPTASRTSDLVTDISPSLVLSGVGAHARLDATMSVPILLYARTSENNYVAPSLNLLGNADLYENKLHIEGAVDVSQQFFTPFGAQPQDFSNVTSNRYRTTTYRVSPYLQDVMQNGIAYELRNNNVWTNLSGAPIDTNNARYTEWIANASSTGERQFGWRAYYDYVDTQFNNQNSIQTQLARFVPLYDFDPQIRLEASIGYEDNQLQLTSSKDTIYGAGFRWRPTERTNVVGRWEHRFFGSSYLFSFDHRTPRTVWNVQASRSITTYPQQLATLQAGTNVTSFVNNLFLSSITDPVARQQAVDQFIRDRGLPSSLLEPVSLYADQILLQQQASATVGLIGVRNTIFFSVFNVRSEPINAAGTPLPPLLAGGNDNTQTGGNIIWTNKITEAVNLVATLDALRTVANAPLTGKTNQGTARISLSTPLSNKMTAYIGARYQALYSDFTQDYNEAAAFIGISYTLR